MANEITKQEQLEQWSEMKRSCESRPKEMSVIEWCEQNGITKATYYYRLRELAKAGIGGKKRKSKSKQKKKKVAVIAAVPVVEENPTEVVTESPEVIGEEPTEVVTESSEVVGEEPAEVMTELAVEENPTEVVAETETTEASAEEETPVAEVAETTETVTESAEEPAVEEVVSVATSTSANRLDVTIGPAVIHVNDKTSPELLSKTILSVISAMQTK